MIDHTQNFICDGVVCPEKWFSQSIRPLYLLKEAYGEGSWDLIADHLCKSGQISQMWRRVSKWTSGLLGTTENTLMPYGNWGDVDHYGNEYLQKIAVVNVKKSGGKSSSNMDEIRAYAQFDREELHFDVDEKGRPIRCYFKKSKDANKLIEEFMLLANLTVAESIGKVPEYGAAEALLRAAQELELDQNGKNR